MSELFDKQVNAQKVRTFGVHASSHKIMEKRVMKIKVEIKKKWTTKMFSMEGVQAEKWYN